MRIFFVSDMHFSHLNIFKYEPIRISLLKNITKEEVMKIYENNDKEKLIELLREHDNELIKRWNQTVKKDDTVWFLGDWGFGDKKHLKELIESLNGKIKMIMGNHDKGNKKLYESCKNIVDVNDSARILKNKFIVSHAPEEGDLGKFYNIFGHVHSQEDIPTETKNSRCVCIERTNFVPIMLDVFNKYQEHIEKNINNETYQYEEVNK